MSNSSQTLLTGSHKCSLIVISLNKEFLLSIDFCQCNWIYSSNKYLKLDGEIKVTIDTDKFQRDNKWDGIKGYITNTKLAPETIVKNYNQLWKIEKAFRISKTDFPENKEAGNGTGKFDERNSERGRI